MTTTARTELLESPEAGLRFDRRPLLLWFVAVNLAFLVGDVWIAHSANAFVPVYEWIPIVVAPPGIATALLLALMRRSGQTLLWLHAAAMLAGVAVGVSGTAFHLQAALAPAGVSWPWIVFGAPVLAPLSFAGVSLVGLVAALREQPGGSGRLWFGERLQLAAPISQVRHLLWLVGLGFAGAAATSYIDHAQYDHTLYEWIPVVYGTFAACLTLAMALARRPARTDRVVYTWTMLAGLLVGLLGVAFHLSRDLADSGALSWQRMRDYAPVLAPLLFADLALLGLITTIRPERD